jgi:hypothetical protein
MKREHRFSIYFHLVTLIYPEFSITVCHCIHLTATYGFEWGSFNINSNQIAFWNGTNSGCLILFIVGASNEIVEVQFNSIKLRAG